MQYAYVDTKRREGTYVRFERRLIDDDHVSSVSGLKESYEGISEDRIESWRSGDWHFVGVVAVAHITIVRNGVGIMYTLTSPGAWGVESDHDDAYVEELYREQREQLTKDMRQISTFTVEGI